MLTTVLTSEVTTLNAGDAMRTIKFSGVSEFVELLMFNATVTITKIDVVITAHQGEHIRHGGPALCGLVPSGYMDKKKGTGSWTKTSASKVNGLEAIPVMGSASTQTITKSFVPANGRIFEMNEKVEPVLLFANPHMALATGKIDAIAFTFFAQVTVTIG